MKYDFLIVGAGLYGAAFARAAADAGRRSLVIDRRSHIGGLAYTEERSGIQVHVYGPHIFHTDNRSVWEFVNRFADFNGFINRPVANYRGELYPLPFSMDTFRSMWGDVSPEEAASIIEHQKQRFPADLSEPSNLEEQAVSLVGTDIYEKLIKGYSEKQWGRPCSELPASLIRRIPLRFTSGCSYYDDAYQGIPEGGYTAMVSNMLGSGLIDLRLNTDYLADKAGLDALTDTVVYTGSLDELFGFRFGQLGYRALRLETEDLVSSDFQGNAVINYTGSEVPWTRITEHKWFSFGKDIRGRDIGSSIISREYAFSYETGQDRQEADAAPFRAGAQVTFTGPAYPLSDSRDLALYAKYKSLAGAEPKLITGGRLGDYKYYDMDDVIANALSDAAAATCLR